MCQEALLFWLFLYIDKQRQQNKDMQNYGFEILFLVWMPLVWQEVMIVENASSLNLELVWGEEFEFDDWPLYNQLTADRTIFIHLDFTSSDNELIRPCTDDLGSSLRYRSSSSSAQPTSSWYHKSSEPTSSNFFVFFWLFVAILDMGSWTLDLWAHHMSSKAQLAKRVPHLAQVQARPWAKPTSYSALLPSLGSTQMHLKDLEPWAQQ